MIKLKKGLTHGIGDVLEEIEHGLSDNDTVIENIQQDVVEEEADKEGLIVRPKAKLGSY